MRRSSLLALIAAAALAVAAPGMTQMPAHVAVNLAGFKGDPGALPDASSPPLKA